MTCHVLIALIVSEVLVRCLILKNYMTTRLEWHARYKIGRNKRARMELISDGAHWTVKSKLRLPVIATRISARLLESRGSTRYPTAHIEKFTELYESV